MQKSASYFIRPGLRALPAIACYCSAFLLFSVNEHPEGGRAFLELCFYFWSCFVIWAALRRLALSLESANSAGRQKLLMAVLVLLWLAPLSLLRMRMVPELFYLVVFTLILFALTTVAQKKNYFGPWIALLIAASTALAFLHITLLKGFFLWPAFLFSLGLGLLHGTAELHHGIEGEEPLWSGDTLPKPEHLEKFLLALYALAPFCFALLTYAHKLPQMYLLCFLPLALTVPFLSRKGKDGPTLLQAEKSYLPLAVSLQASLTVLILLLCRFLLSS